MIKTDKELKQAVNQIKIDQNDIFQYAKAMTKMPVEDIISTRQKNKLLKKYSREQIQRWLNSPQKRENEDKLREVIDYLCRISPQFTKLIEYLPNMAMITPFVKQNMREYSEKEKGLFAKKKTKDKKLKDFENMCKEYERLNVKKNSNMIVREVFKYGIFYGLKMEGLYEKYIKKLDPFRCKIISEGESGLGIACDMSYFNNNDYILDNAYPPQFRTMYNTYKAGLKTLDGLKLGAEWQPVPLELSVVFKYDMSTLDYSIPPYVNAFYSLYDLEEYQALNKAKVSAENYTLIGLKLPTINGASEPDKYAVSPAMVDATTDMLDASLPDYMGYFTTGADIIPVKGSTSSDSKVDQVASATKNVWESQGMASVMFGVDNTNSGTLSYSVKTDEQQLFKIYDQLERYWNMELRDKFKNKFKFILLRVSWFNVDKFLENVLKCSQMSVPVAQLIPLLLGVEITDIDDLCVMQDEIFNIYENWKPLSSSFTSSGDTTDKGGRPTSEDGNLTESGQQTRDNESNSKR